MGGIRSAEDVDESLSTALTTRIVAVLGVVAVTALLGAGLAAPAAADTGSDAAYVTTPRAATIRTARAVGSDLSTSSALRIPPI